MGSSANYSLPIGFVLQGQVYTYTIEKVLGQGSFGITYLASTVIQGPLGDVTVQVAVKEFFAKELDSRWSGGLVATRKEGSFAYKYAKAFQRESRNLSRMKHPGIVRVLEAFEANGTYYYSMEYLSGGSLDDKVKGVGIPETEALSLVRKIGDALSYMHASKIMHLDLKPKNIMLKGDGSPVIIDFGLSKQYDDEGEPESSSSIGLGTPGYAPLEQATQSASREFQPTLDIYALGATLYKILTGATPPEATLILNRKASPQTLLQNKGISESTIQAVQKAMSPIVEDRPQSVAGFLLMLEGKGVEPEHEAEDETEPKPVPKPTASHAPAEKPPVILRGSEESKGKPKTWLWALLGGLVALAVILASVFGGKGGNQGAGGNLGVDTLAVVPVDSSVETPVAPSVNEPVPEAPGSIKITSEPAGAAIWLDGKNTKKQTPEIMEDVAPGKHTYKLVLDGYKDDSGSMTVTSGQRAIVARTLNADPKPYPYPEPYPEPSDSPALTGSAATAGSASSSSVTTGSINGHEWVDLGLSVKWATCNVGAGSPEDYGNYYAWGETSTKDDFSWETLKYSVSGDSWENVTFSKYNTESERGFVDNNTCLDLSDDAARQNWGGRWRIPTKAEWEELNSKCTWTWTALGGKNGYKVAGKNGNSIFLPAEGNRRGVSSLVGDGDCGYYWSSSLDTDSPLFAWDMFFETGYHYLDSSHRFNGESVRPVTE